MIWILKSRDGDSFPPTSSFAFLSNSWLIKVQNFPCFTMPLAIFIRNLMSDYIHLRCVNTTAGRPISWILLAPAVSPREPGLAEGAGPNNPAIRLVKFNTNNGQVRRKLRLNVSSHVHPSSVNRKDKKVETLVVVVVSCSRYRTRVSRWFIIRVKADFYSLRTSRLRLNAASKILPFDIGYLRPTPLTTCSLLFIWKPRATATSIRLCITNLWAGSDHYKGCCLIVSQLLISP